MRSAGTSELKGKLAIANARLAYAHYLEAFSGPRWEFLAGKGATPSACCGPRPPSRTPTTPTRSYVEELIGPDTVNTMPEETIKAYQDHGDPKPRLEQRPRRGARACSSELAAAGVDYDDLTETLEREGVEKFADSFDELMSRWPRSAQAPAARA